MLPRVIAPDYVECIATSSTRPIAIHVEESSTTSIAFSDGRLLVVDAEKSGSTYTHQFDLDEPADLATCSADGSMWAFAGSGKVVVFDWRTPRERRSARIGEIPLDSALDYHFNVFSSACLAVSPAGDVLAVDDVSTCASLYQLCGRARAVSWTMSRVIGGAFVGDGGQVALLGDDEVLRLFDPDGSERRCFSRARHECGLNVTFMGFVEGINTMAIARAVDYGSSFHPISLTTGQVEEMGSYSLSFLPRGGRHMTPTPWRDGWLTIDSAGGIGVKPGAPGTLQVRLPHEDVAIARLLPSGNHVVYVPWDGMRFAGPYTVWVAGLHTAMRYARHLERGELAEAGELDVQFAKRREGEQVCGRCGWIRVSIGNGTSCHCDH